VFVSHLLLRLSHGFSRRIREIRPAAGVTFGRVGDAVSDGGFIKSRTGQVVPLPLQVLHFIWPEPPQFLHVE
jgi:hypothetical protein